MRIMGTIGTAAVVAIESLLKVAARVLDRDVALRCFARISSSRCALGLFLGAAITVTPVHSETGKYFEKWTKSEGFDVGYACNMWKDVPGPESMFEARKLKATKILADVGSAEFRMIKPTPNTGAIDTFKGSLFTIRVDGNAEAASSIRIVYAFSKNGFCSFILISDDGSSIKILRELDVAVAPPSRKALRWIDRTIPECHRRLRRAVDPNLIFDCVVSREQNPSEGQPTEGLLSSFMPEEVVPASVARVYLENRGKTFAVTTFGDTIEILKVSAP